MPLLTAKLSVVGMITCFSSFSEVSTGPVALYRQFATFFKWTISTFEEIGVLVVNSEKRQIGCKFKEKGELDVYSKKKSINHQ